MPYCLGIMGLKSSWKLCKNLMTTFSISPTTMDHTVTKSLIMSNVLKGDFSKWFFNIVSELSEISLLKRVQDQSSRKNMTTLELYSKW